MTNTIADRAVCDLDIAEGAILRLRDETERLNRLVAALEAELAEARKCLDEIQHSPE